MSALFTQTSMAGLHGAKATWFRCNGCGARIKHGAGALVDHAKKHAKGAIPERKAP